MKKTMRTIKILLTLTVFIAVMAAGMIVSAANLPRVVIYSSDAAVHARTGSTFNFDLNFYGNYEERVSSASYNFNDFGPFSLMRGSASVASIAFGSRYAYTLHVPEGTTPGVYYLSYTVNYTYSKTATIPAEPAADDLVSESVSYYVTVTVSGEGADVERLRIDYLEYPDRVNPSQSVTIGVFLLNESAVHFRDTRIEILDGATSLVSKEKGTIRAGTDVSEELTIPGFSTIGNKNLTVRVTYTENNITRTASKTFTLRVQAADSSTTGALRFQSVDTSKKVFVDTPTILPFEVINASKDAVYNTEVFVTRQNGNEVGRVYIGFIRGQEMSEGAISMTFSIPGTYNLVLNAVADAEDGGRVSVARNFTLTVQAESNESGSLRVQSLTPPEEALIKARSPIEFYLTNDTDTAIKGAEAFLFDGTGAEVNSVYIPEIAGNFSHREELTFLAGSTAGTYSYTLRVIYKDGDNVSHTINRNFTVNVVAEKSDEPGTERPASMRIQKIENPAIMYLSVDTKISYTVVNAGRGNAYNTEVYVTNAAGEELTREYIGVIEASRTMQGELKLRFDEVGEEELYFHVEYESADETRTTIEKKFYQQVIAYRASVTDIAGFDWIMANEPANIEFSVLNNGSETLLNATAELIDADGNSYGELFIGSIEPGTKKERQRFRNIVFFTPGLSEMTIVVTYENDSMKQFSFSNNFNAMVNEPWIPEWNDDPIYPEWDDPAMEVDGEDDGGLAWWIWALIGAGVLIPGIIVLVVILRRISAKKENAEMERYVQMLAGAGGVQPIKEQAVEEDEDSE